MLKYNFEEQLVLSNGIAASADVESILLQHIPGSVSVKKASLANDKQGVDWWVEMNTAKHLAIDAKVRNEDWAATHPYEDDLALESWSVVEKKVIGWTRDINKKCDYVLWLWKTTGRFCLIPFPLLCHVFINNWEQWSTQYKTRRQYTTRAKNGYQSECIFVPRRDLWAAIYKTFGGAGFTNMRAKTQHAA